MPLEVLQPLLDLRNTLTSLSCCCVGDRHGANIWRRDQLDIIRGLTGLTDLSLRGGRLLLVELDQLTAGNPIPFQLKRLDLRDTSIDDRFAPSLARITTLTAFEPYYIELEDASFLGSMVQLEILRLDCDDIDIVDVPILLTALAHCSRIHTLHLSHPHFSDAHLTTLLSMLPHIRHVRLVCMGALTDLTFASAVSHLGVTLESLTILDSRHISLTGLCHLRSLHALRRLELTRSFGDAPDVHMLACFTPSDPHFLRDEWPHLIHFQFTL
jgi:hypothetical protein